MLEKFFVTKNPDPNRDSRADLKELVDRYDRIFKGSRGYGFMDWDMSSGQVYWQGRFWAHLGYQQEEVIKAERAEDFLKYLHPDDREEYSQSVIDLIKYRERKNLICRAIRKDGTFVWIELRIDALRDQSGRATHLSGIIFDISALKETEEALKVTEARHARIIKASNDGMWEWSVEHGGVRMKRSGGGWDWPSLSKGFTFSARCWDMIGYDERDTSVSKDMGTWRRRMHSEDGKRFDTLLLAHMTKGVPFDVEYRVRAKDGEWRWIRARGSMSRDADGRPDMLSGTNMDITELKRAEERVIKAKEEAEKASQAKSEFLSVMSHELRTPLNAILGFAQLLELDTTLSAEQSENVKEIKLAGKHLLELVGDVLDLAKIEAGQLKLSLEKVVPSRVIDECAAILKPQFERHSLLLDIQYNGLETQAILADQIRLKQVVLNLMGNACKYNKHGGRVGVSCLLEGSDMKITIADNGLGIPAHLQAELFQPFNRLGAERSGVEGSGVGLVITKQLVSQMAGEIGFESEEHLGSEFWVKFPVVGEEEGPLLPAEYKNKASHVDDEDKIPELLIKDRKRVLYVEDNPSNQKLLKQVLAKFPVLDLTVVGLAVQGLFVARSTKPDLVILDVNLPGVSGYEIVEILKQDPSTKHIPVIALSANVLSHDIKKGLDAGFDHYLTKPLNIGQFLTICNDLLA